MTLPRGTQVGLQCVIVAFPGHTRLPFQCFYVKAAHMEWAEMGNGVVSQSLDENQFILEAIQP